jgi:radical SAM superfamily enzyme YgiQ (UPF0313 family)
MKILLVAINAKYIHSNLAVYSLRAYGRKYSNQCNIVEYTINHSLEDILKGIYKEQADVIAFSCYIWNMDMVSRLSIELAKVCPKAEIWYGGPEVSYDAKQCLLKHSEIKGIMIGEGEQTFLEILEHYVEENIRLKDIAGIAYRSDNIEDIHITAPRQPLSMDDLIFPYEEMDYFKNKIIYYESSRGCPFSCSYCLSSIDKKVRLRNTELVNIDLKVLMDYHVPQVKFVDRTFNCNKRHAMGIWRFIKDHDNGITNFHFEISADLLDEEEIEFLSTLRPGQVQFEIGVQSTNPVTIGAIHRKMDLTKLYANVNLIKKAGNIHQHLDLIAGLPMEDYYCFEKSFGEVYQLKPDQLQLGFLKILKGSLMEEECDRYGIVYRKSPPYEVLFTKDLTYGEVLRIKDVCEMVEVYYNSGQFTNAILYLEHYYNAPMKLYEAIGDYYENKGLALLSHSRVKRYELLYDFFKDQIVKLLPPNEQEEAIVLFEEILILDLFLREDLKSRPGFVTKPPELQTLRAYYARYNPERKNVHIELFDYDVLQSAASGKLCKGRGALMFDYENRDPLNKSAQVIQLDLL